MRTGLLASIGSCTTGVLTATLSRAAHAAEPHVSFLDPQGPIAAMQRTHFVEVLTLLAVFVALPIFVLIPWLAWRYRYGATTSGYRPRWQASIVFEVLAWSGPAVIVTMLAVLVWRSTITVDPYRPLPSDQPPLRIQVVGYDWKWLFIYPDEGVASIGVMPVPVGRPLALELTSATVMQSLLIPSLGSQIYAMGGMTTRLHLQADRPGRFMGENTMYNGDGFHQQRFTTVGMSADAFRGWVQRATSDGMPLDRSTFDLIAQRATFDALKDALHPVGDFDGGLYFNRVDPNAFHDILMATMHGSDRAGSSPSDPRGPSMMRPSPGCRRRRANRRCP